LFPQVQKRHEEVDLGVQQAVPLRKGVPRTLLDDDSWQ
jgi:hypothetical protein